MAAAATARKPAARRASARRATARPARTAPRRRSQHTPIPGRLVPIAVGRTAHAVGGLADSGLVFRLTRGRLWIGALAALLVGIVALNVMALSFNASSSKSAGAADGLERQNSALRAQLAERLSNDRIQQMAATLGLIVPTAGSVRYPDTGPDDAATAAKRLRSGDLVGGLAPVAPAAPVATTPQPVAPTESAVTETAPTPDPVAEAPVAPAAAASGVPAAGGGVASP